MKTPEAKAKYNKQRNICVSLTRKAKRNYYESLDLNNICDNNKFWPSVKSYFSNKIKSIENNVLSENGVLIKDEEEVAKIFNNFFVNTVANLGIKTQHKSLNTTDNSQDPIENAICKYENHPSIILIKKHMEGANSSFVFESVTKEKIEKLITNLNIRKAVQSNNIPTKLVKGFGYIFSKYIATSINRCITGGTFVNEFKKAEVWPIYKKDRRTELQTHYVLSNVSKIYERRIYEQMYSYFDKIFSKNQCSSRKGFNTQHILLAIIEKMKAWRDNKQFCAAILTGLRKLKWVVHSAVN